MELHELVRFLFVFTHDWYMQMFDLIYIFSVNWKIVDIDNFFYYYYYQ